MFEAGVVLFSSPETFAFAPCAVVFSVLGFAVVPAPALDAVPVEGAGADGAVVLSTVFAVGAADALFADGAVEVAGALVVVVTLFPSEAPSPLSTDLRTRPFGT